MAWRSNLAQHLRGLRFVCCTEEPGSSGLRGFVRGNFAGLKAMNSSFPLLVREAPGAPAELRATLRNGQEMVVAVEGMNAAQVETELAKILKSATR